MKTILTVAAFSILLGGCSSTSTVEIEGKQYQQDENGAVKMTQAEYDTVVETPTLTNSVPPILNVTEFEYELLKTNGEALFSLAGMASPDDNVSALIKRGSAKSNIQRMMKENGWGKLYFEGQDYLINSSYILDSEGVETAVLQVLDQEPIYACFDADEKSVTIIKADVENLLYDQSSGQSQTKIAFVEEE